MMACEASLIGIDLGATWLRLCRIGTSSSELLKFRTPSASEVHERLSRELGRLLHGTDTGVPIGLARAPGLDGTGHVSAWPSRPDWIGVPLLPTIAGVARSAPCSADDGVCAAIWEHRAHRFPMTSTTACLTLGTGLGIGIVRNGIPVCTGDGADTIGHLPLGDPALVCVCGKNGCLQATLCPSRLRRGPHAPTRALVDRVLREVWTYLRAHYGVERVVLTGGAVGTLGTLSGVDVSPLSEPATSGTASEPRFRLSSTPALSALGGALVLAAAATADHPQVTTRIGRVLQQWQLLTRAFAPGLPSSEPQSSTTTCAVPA